jgi:hypothetical protein
MSYRIRDDIQRNDKEILLEKYVKADDILRREGTRYNWLDAFLLLCFNEALSEGRKPTLKDIYELNVKPLSLKVGISVTYDDLKVAYGKLLSLGYSLPLHINIGSEVVEKAMKELKRIGLVREPSLEICEFTEDFNDIYRKMCDITINYTADLAAKLLVKSLINPEPAYIYSDKCCRDIITKFVKEHNPQYDEKILMGILYGVTYTQLWNLADEVKEKRRVMSDVEFKCIYIIAKLIASINLYACYRIPTILKMEDLLKLSPNEIRNRLIELKKAVKFSELPKRMLDGLIVQFLEEDAR